MLTMISPSSIDWPAIGSGLYSYWFVAVSVFGLLTWLFRSPIAKHARRVVNALHSAKEQVRKIDALEERLTQARDRAADWRARFSEMEARYEALKTELSHLGDDMKEFRKRMNTAEMLVRVLTRDRDALIDHTRKLIGQMFQAGLTPDYQTPSLESMVDVPGPPIVLPHPAEHI